MRADAYLDNAASMPVHPLVLEAMAEYMSDLPTANPTGAHLSAQKARKVLDDSRELIADICGLGSVGARGGARGTIGTGGVVFTSGGTEANNLAIFGSAAGTFLCSAIEHPSVLRPIEARAEETIETAAGGGGIIAVSTTGELNLDDLTEKLKESSDSQMKNGQSTNRQPKSGVFISIMTVNNEVGTIQPLKQAASLVRQHFPNAILHTDASQALAWLDIADLAADYDLISISSHKFGGPMGVGALLIRSPNETKIRPQLLGGEQERDIRSGTQNVPGALGMATALQLAALNRSENNKRVAALRDKLLAGLRSEIPDLWITAKDAPVISGCAHICIPGIDSEALLFLMTNKGLEASAASSCASGAKGASGVLAAMGVPPDVAMGSLRLSLGPATSEAEIDRALEVIPQAVSQIRASQNARRRETKVSAGGRG